MKTYLIQRASFMDRDYKNGIDSIISLDYMGSSEFEWGAVPQSLARIREDINAYTYLDVPIYNKDITVFCKETQKPLVKEYLTNLADCNMRLKEYSDFDYYVNPSEYYRVRREISHHRTDFWWDLENDLMFWKKNPDFEVKFKQVIQYKK